MAELFESQSDAAVIAGYAQIALERGIDAAPEGLTYAFGRQLDGLKVGDRVIVPLGKRNRAATGYVIGLTQTSTLNSIKFIKSRDDQAVSLTADLVELARWLGAYYCCPLGMVFGTMLPAAVKKGTGTIRQMQVRLAPRPGAEVKLTKLQSVVVDEAVALDKEGKPWMALKHLADRAGAKSVAPVKQLINKGVLVTRLHTLVRADRCEGSARIDEPSVELTAAQRQAVHCIINDFDRGFSAHLLYGVTGSGKTEVYLQVVEHLLRTSQTGAIVLVPEIALTPQTVARFRQRFEQVAVLHSGLSAAQRHEQWRRIRNGKARIVVGARSAIFAPLASVGLIVVDEEHEQSYKQDQLPRYHARDVAVKRAQLSGAVVVLGSATPSLESYYNARCRGVYKYHVLPDRVTGLNLPKVQIVDMRRQRRRRRGVHLLSTQLENLLRDTLERKGQALLLLNRRGYANYIACCDYRCGWMMNCLYCDAMMVFHKDRHLPTGGLLRCHHCAAEQLLASQCPVCKKKVMVFGLGTQRVEEEIGRKFAAARLGRMDSDTMRTGHDYHNCLEAFYRGEIDILIGTQMIAKGLDFPNVRLVGVISADTALHLPDFRAAERTFALISQVAGRAGRGDQPGAVVVQTFSPQDVVIILASRHDYETFAEREIALRRDVGLPPAVRLARIVVRDSDHAACDKQAAKLAEHLQAFNRHLDNQVSVRGPMDCPISRIAGFYRQQIELLAPSAVILQRLMTALRNARLLHSDARTAVDVDPVQML